MAGSGFHRIRHYGLIANAARKVNFAKARKLLHVIADANAPTQSADAPVGIDQPTFVCPDCGAAIIIIDTLTRAQPIRAPPSRRGAA